MFLSSSDHSVPKLCSFLIKNIDIDTVRAWPFSLLKPASRHWPCDANDDDDARHCPCPCTAGSKIQRSVISNFPVPVLFGDDREGVGEEKKKTLFVHLKTFF